MAYELKAGQGTIFKNNKKEKEIHPDYRGTIKTPDGNEYSVSLWVKKGEKQSYFSVSVQEPYNTGNQQQAIPTDKNGLPDYAAPEDDDLPF